MSAKAPAVRVDSEVGRLRRVLVHEPGPEVDQMVPSMMEVLLFDDILYGDRAREEHRIFRQVLERLGVEVIEALDLLEGALEVDEGRRWLEARVRPHLLPEFQERLGAMTPREAAEALVGGVRRFGVTPARSPDDLFGIRPLPNWCFQRDTQVVLGDAVLFSAMASPARYREAVLARAIFRFHPILAPAPLLAEIAPDEEADEAEGRSGAFPPQPSAPDGDSSASDGDLSAPHGDLPTLEGGDVLVLSPDIIAVGRSERTSLQGVARLVEALRKREGGPRWLFQVELPRERAFMHLDTLFTPVDRAAALVFSPIILPGSPASARVVEYDLHSASAPEPVVRDDLLSALDRRGLALEPIPCGGDDPMDQQREQWTDGANVLALAPGVVVLYDRNVRTAEELARRGFRIVKAADLLEGRARVRLEGEGRACILVPSGELSRARGGPHCLTHPLIRDPL